MAKEIYDFVSGLERAVSDDVALEAEFTRILFCGMGGSADSGEIIRSCVMGKANVPISVWRFPELPSWVGRETMVIISSYSGNTLETVSMYRQAKNRGCPIIVITAGGDLETQGMSDGFPVFRLDSGIQPRNALGISLSHLAKIMDSLCGTSCVKDIARILPSLRAYREELAEGGEALRLAQAVGNRVPVVYATTGLRAASIRWKNQINENAKMMAFAGSIPEFNHNETNGWLLGRIRAVCIPFFLCESSIEESAAAGGFIDFLRDSGQDVNVVRVEGETPLERTIRAVMAGDNMSLHLAQCRKVDPMDISFINMFKQRMLAKSGRGDI
ncbi:MAG: SIS domain-containing protein [Candidatus Methanoplasma sp.]|jgi:glucose/mannose-6-phosphate isomerase|nr:SIS domain-containing protein [Candidatus Methanoplasma sp.]